MKRATAPSASSVIIKTIRGAWSGLALSSRKTGVVDSVIPRMIIALMLITVDTRP
jgi:hypothetical protein